MHWQLLLSSLLFLTPPLPLHPSSPTPFPGPPQISYSYSPATLVDYAADSITSAPPLSRRTLSDNVKRMQRIFDSLQIDQWKEVSRARAGDRPVRIFPCAPGRPSSFSQPRPPHPLPPPLPRAEL